MFENLTEKLQRAFKNLRGQGNLTEETSLRPCGRFASASARSRRQPQRRQGTHRAHPRQGPRPGSADRPLALRSRSSRSSATNSSNCSAATPPLQVRLAAAHRHSHGRPARLRQNHHQRQARPLAQEGRPPPHARLRRRLPPRRPRAAQSRRQAIKRRALRGQSRTNRPTPRLVERLAKEARREAVNLACDTLIVDTAGRLHIDDELMDEMAAAQKAAQSPGNPLRRRRHDRPGRRQLRRGLPQAPRHSPASSSPRWTATPAAARPSPSATSPAQPIKFIGTGEKPDAFEPFHPDRIVGRILGMGDMLSLIEKAERHSTRRKPRSSPRRPSSATASPSKTSATSCGRSKRWARSKSIIEMLPSVGPFADCRRPPTSGREAVHPRRSHHQFHDAPRARRSRRHQRQPPQAHRPGLRHHVQEVNQLLRQYAQMRKMFKQMGKASFPAGSRA